MTQNMKSRWTVAVVGALALASPALAGDRHGFRDDPGYDFDRLEDRLDERAERIADLLELTADQRAAFERLRYEALEGAQAEIERLRAAGEGMHQLLDSGTTDAARVGALAIEAHQLRNELKAAKESVERELVELLTEEQRFAFEALKEARHDLPGRGGRRFGHGPRRPMDDAPPSR